MSSVLDVKPLFTAEQLARRVRELGAQISADYAGKQLIVVGVLKGAWVFMADLVRELSVGARSQAKVGARSPDRAPIVRCDFVRLSSYGVGTVSSGEVKMILEMTLDIAGQHVLVVEDIIDTGASLSWLLGILRERKPASLKLCALLDKPSRRKSSVQIDYLGFTIPDQFVVGYGIDCGEQYRELPYVGFV